MSVNNTNIINATKLSSGSYIIVIKDINGLTENHNFIKR